MTQEFHSVNVFDFDPEKVTKITIKGPATLVLEKTDGKWKTVQPATPAVSSFKTDSFIEEFSELKTERFAEYKASDLKQYGLDEPALTLEFAFPQKTIALLVGLEKEGKYFVKKSGLPGVFYLDAKVVEPLMRPEKIFVKEVKRLEEGKPITDIKIKKAKPQPEKEEEKERLHQH